jgi:ketosteroid isomerase-like protein
MANVTPELVRKAYAALASGDMDQIKQYWAEDMNWLVPGHNQLSGWYHGRDGFLAFMGNVGRLSANSFHMDSIVTITSDDYSADVTRNVGYRAKDDDKSDIPYKKLDIDVVHVLHWRNSQVIEGRGAIFGDGAAQYDQFWSRIGESTNKE